jgi:hypothetical protein
VFKRLRIANTANANLLFLDNFIITTPYVTLTKAPRLRRARVKSTYEVNSWIEPGRTTLEP